MNTYQTLQQKLLGLASLAYLVALAPIGLRYLGGSEPAVAGEMATV